MKILLAIEACDRKPDLGKISKGYELILKIRSTRSMKLRELAEPCDCGLEHGFQGGVSQVK